MRRALWWLCPLIVVACASQPPAVTGRADGDWQFVEARIAHAQETAQASGSPVSVSEGVFRNIATDLALNYRNRSSLEFELDLLNISRRLPALVDEQERKASTSTGAASLSRQAAARAINEGHLISAIRILDAATVQARRSGTTDQAAQLAEDAAMIADYIDRRDAARRWGELADASILPRMRWQFRMKQARSLYPWPEEAEEIYRNEVIPESPGSENLAASQLALGQFLLRTGTRHGDMDAVQRSIDALEAALGSQASENQRPYIEGLLAEAREFMVGADGPSTNHQ